MDELEREQQPFFHKIQPQESSFKLISKVSLIGTVIIILSGVVTGYILSRSQGVTHLPGLPSSSSSGIQKGQIFGSEDTKTFRDTTEGTLEKGGVNGEGSHKLVRPGDESQTAALTSSIVDLDLFVSRKIKVWGETQKAKKAGWLMDVGRVEVLE